VTKQQQPCRAPCQGKRAGGTLAARRCAVHTHARAPNLCTRPRPGRRGRVDIAEVVHRHLGRRPIHGMKIFFCFFSKR